MSDEDLVLFLLDPELIVPSTEHEADEGFWKRFKMVKDDARILRIGEWSKDIALEFYARLCGMRLVTESRLNTRDLAREYGKSLRSLKEADESPSPVPCGEIDEEMYRPLYGPDFTREALQYDLSRSISQGVFADKASWNCLEDKATHIFGDTLLVDIGAGTEECARAWLRDHPRFRAIESLSSIAFPRLRFCLESFGGLGKLRQREDWFGPVTVTVLSAINDHALEVWEQTTEGSVRADLMQSYGAPCSPERNDDLKGKYGEMRTFTYQDTKLLMNWHAKLSPRLGRIYFSVCPTSEVVTIGCITDHLQLSNRRHKVST